MNNIDTFYDAVRNCHLDRIKALLRDNPDLMFGKDNKGDTPLHWAALDGRKDAVELLLANHAEINAKDNSGLTPLHYAAALGFKPVAELLLANHADVNARDNDGRMPLHVAAKESASDAEPDAPRTEAAKVLLANNAEVNAKDNDGRTPLHYAVIGATPGLADMNYPYLAALLLANGADVNAKDNNGWTPLHMAKRNGEATELLRQRGGHE